MPGWMKKEKKAGLAQNRVAASLGRTGVVTDDWPCSVVLERMDAAIFSFIKRRLMQIY